jgi:hypothetical protein
VGRLLSTRKLAPVVTVLLAVMLALVAGPDRPARAAGTPLREVDWPSVFANDPTMTVVPPRRATDNTPGLHVVVPLPDGHDLDGYVLRDTIVYGDLDGDGADEAAIYVFGGASFHSWGFLLYHEDTPAPKRILVQTGDRVSANIEDGHLIVSEDHFVGFEDACCGSATTHTTTSLNGDVLVPLSISVEPHDVHRPTVEAFYRALSEGAYQDAYDFLSPAFQADNPFEQWRAGVANTQDFTVKTSQGATPIDVQIDLTTTDKAPGDSEKHQFRGSWRLMFSVQQLRWLLDRATIEQVS